MPTRGSSALHRSLDDHWQAYRTALNACRTRLSEPHVHDLRLAIRQLLATLALLHSISAKPIPGALNRQLKHQLDHFTTLRDTQVMLQTLTETGDATSVLNAFALHLQQQARHLLQQNRAFVHTIKRQTLHRKLKRLHHHIRRHPPPQGWATAAQQALQHAFDTVIQRHQQLDAHQTDSLHRLRIALKKFRYLQIAAQPLLPYPLAPNACKPSLNWLGQVQDAAVLQRSLAAFYQDAIPTQRYQARLQQLLALATTQALTVPPLWPNTHP